MTTSLENPSVEVPVCNISFPAAGTSEARIDLLCVSVEDEFLGVSMTERHGLNVRRVSGELREIADIVALRDTLNAFIALRSTRISAPPQDRRAATAAYAGAGLLQYLEDATMRWHGGAGNGLTLRHYLGLTADEYAVFSTDPQKIEQCFNKADADIAAMMRQ